MSVQPPIKTTPGDVEALASYLRTQVGWCQVDDIRKRLSSKQADNRKLEAMRYIGLIDRDGLNVKLSDEGREFAKGDEAKRASVLRERMKEIPLYSATLDWMHFNKHEVVSKTEIANYWHDKLQDEIGGTSGSALTDAAVLFLRFVGAAGMGKFVAAGRGRDTEIRLDRAALAQLVDTAANVPPENDPKDAGQILIKEPLGANGKTLIEKPATVIPGLHVNVEIHIAADAKPATIEEIFRNMRKYLLEEPSGAAKPG